MEVLYGIDEYINDQPLILALGNFDGLHLGHRQILKAAQKKAKELDARSGILIFNPHPLNVINGPQETPLLTPLTAKLKLIEEMGIDLAIILPFDQEFASIFPEDFVRKFLINKLKIKGVVIGFDYSFGYRGLGKADDLKNLAKRFGFQVEIVNPVLVDNRIVSSSLIRNLIKSGEVNVACRYLGYYPFIEGKVIEGEGRGKFLGYPTANLSVDKNVVVPGNGVYLTLTCLRGNNYYSLTNIGYNPTFKGKFRNIEVHMIKFQGNIYNHELRLKFVQKIRDERTFSNSEELKEQIGKDFKVAKEIIKRCFLYKNIQL